MKLRVAWASDDLDALVPFYRDGLGLAVLARFRDHDGFDGIIFGREGAPHHFEFTRHRGHAAGRASVRDDLVVFYVPDASEWGAAVARMEAAGFTPVPARNPYWARRGATFEDPDGRRVAIQRAAWDA